MIASVSRRTFVSASAAVAAALALSSGATAASHDLFRDRVLEIEERLRARVGVTVSDVGTNRHWNHRADERFPMASTFKAFACAALLARIDAGEKRLEDRVLVRSSDLVPYAPAAEKRVGETMSLAEVCSAATALSDNVAGNLILDAIGGPAGLTAFMRNIGDTETRSDRRETELNEGIPGDPRDTTTPAAAAASLGKLLLGDVLSAGSRKQLNDWLLANRVGGPLLRAGLPRDWRVADRTGAGGHGTRNVLAALWPPRRGPVLTAVYVTETEAPIEARNAAIAEIGRFLSDLVES